MTTRLYDKARKRLVYAAQSASSDFWDFHWADHRRDTYLNPPSHRFTVWFTRRYLPAGAAVLEGGCGMGDKVFALDRAGFKVKGIDYAVATVAMTRQYWPHLAISLGDVRQLPLASECVDGYWSLGVIEHFVDGYTHIANEMARVLRPGGYLFLTFPMMNTVRSMQAKKGAYGPWEEADANLKRNFYQYALDPNEVIEQFKSLGFTVAHQGGQSSFDCLADETRWFKPVDRLLRSLPFELRTKLGVIADMFAGKFFGHVALLALRKSTMQKSPTL
jgi:SAM-dependent methyltransferase